MPTATAFSSAKDAAHATAAARCATAAQPAARDAARPAHAARAAATAAGHGAARAALLPPNLCAHAIEPSMFTCNPGIHRLKYTHRRFLRLGRRRRCRIRWLRHCTVFRLLRQRMCALPRPLLGPRIAGSPAHAAATAHAPRDWLAHAPPDAHLFFWRTLAQHARQRHWDHGWRRAHQDNETLPTQAHAPQAAGCRVRRYRRDHRCERRPGGHSGMYRR
jgi:hypothetical protein